jgi:pentatricopeptide repeat protein
MQCFHGAGSADLALAMKVIEQMVATVETIQSEPFLSILGLCQAQEAKVEAVRIFQLMQAEGLEPNATAYSALLGSLLVKLHCADGLRLLILPCVAQIVHTPRATCICVW